MGNFQTLRDIARLLNLIIKLMIISLKQQYDGYTELSVSELDRISREADSITKW